jgi:tetratricopeptide (TPR) repeat protein
MIGGTFINRESELARFQLEFATTTPARNCVIILAAPSGFGKSEFTERIIAEQHSTIGLKVRIPANADGDAPFVRALAAEVNRVAERDRALLTGDAFLRGVPSSRVRKMHDSALIRDVGAAGSLKGISDIAARIGDRVSNTGEYDFARVLRDTSRDSTVKIFEYLRYVFAQQRFCAAIENIQSIDAASESMLEQVLAVQRGHFFVLEYTLDVIPTRDLETLQRVLAEHGNDVKVFILDRLPLQEIIERSEYRLDASIQMELYANFDGNLRKVKDLVLIRMKSPEFVGVGSAKQTGFLEATRQLVHSLQPTAQFVLALIVTHRSVASHEALLELSLASRYFRDTHVGVEDALRELILNDLVHEARARVTVAHDSIAAEVTSAFSKYVALANTAWAAHYRRKLDRQDFSESSKDQILDFLFGFYVRTDPTKLQPLLGEVRRVALSSFSMQRAESILQSIEDSLHEQTPDEAYEQTLRWELLDTYYTAGLYHRALATLLQIRTRPLRRAVFHAAILDRLDRHVEAIQLIKRNLQTRLARHDSFELSLKLIEMICHRSINDYDACYSVHREIESIREYAALPEYGYFLRNSEIVMSIAESVPLLERSIQIFQSHHREAAEAQSRISVGMQFVRLGRLDEAEREFDTAEKLLGDRRIEWHVIHNDRAVLNLYRDEPDYERIDELLVAAYLTASIPFDRIAIENNRLATHAFMNDFDFCDALVRELADKAPEQTDDVLLCITYFNISVYHERRGDHVRADRFRRLARHTGNDWPAYWAYRFDGTPITSDPAAEYLARYPFDLVLLSSWHIEISDFGERFES